MTIQEPELHIEFLLFIGIASILTISVYSATTSFLSATPTECFGDVNELGSVICIATTDAGKTIIFECTVTQNPYHVDCHDIKKVSVPPGVKANIDSIVKQAVESDTKDSKDIGGLKNDNTNQTTVLSPDLGTQERKAGEVPKQLEFPNKTILDTLK